MPCCTIGQCFARLALGRADRGWTALKSVSAYMPCAKNGLATRNNQCPFVN